MSIRREVRKMGVNKFLADYTRCIRCTGCEAACKTQNGVPVGVRRIRVVTVNEGEPGERNVPMPCFHCHDAPCIKVCPTRTLYKRGDGVVLHTKDICIGCGYCLTACPFGAPQYPGGGIFGSRGKMDKCSFCVQPFDQKDEQGNMIENEAKPRCAGFCATKALLGGDSTEISKKFRERAASKISPLTVNV
jgi:formate dehydrogenase iron-sulfur subunit